MTVLQAPQQCWGNEWYLILAGFALLKILAKWKELSLGIVEMDFFFGI